MLSGTERHPHAAAVLGAALPGAGPGLRPSHAYLFHGPAGSGKRAVARAFAAALLSDGLGATEAQAVATRVDHGAHPDLTWVKPRSAAGILVGDIDEAVVAAATRTPFEARRRVFVIEAADELNDQAANRMLKTLEEPPSFAHLLLLTSRPGEVLPTIRSRCQPVRFDAPPVGELARFVGSRGVPPETADACARLALGDGERALALALGTGPALRAASEGLARAALRDELAGAPWTALLDPAKATGEQAGEAALAGIEDELDFVPKKEQKRVKREREEAATRAQRRARTAALDHGLQLVGLWYRDLACVADGAEDVVHHSDRLDALREDAAGRSPHGLRAALVHVEDTRASLQLNPSEELALEAMALRVAGEFV
jgi:DNA polymerase-3 subunit delta'